MLQRGSGAGTEVDSRAPGPGRHGWALLRDLVGDVGQGEAADVLGIDRKTVWRSLGAGRLTPRLADALERLLLAGGGSAAATGSGSRWMRWSGGSTG